MNYATDSAGLLGKKTRIVAMNRLALTSTSAKKNSCVSILNGSAQVNDAELDVMYHTSMVLRILRNLTQQLLLNFERLEFASQCAAWQHCFTFLQLHFAVSTWLKKDQLSSYKSGDLELTLRLMDGRFTGFAAGLRRW